MKDRVAVGEACLEIVFKEADGDIEQALQEVDETVFVVVSFNSDVEAVFESHEVGFAAVALDA